MGASRELGGSEGSGAPLRGLVQPFFNAMVRCTVPRRHVEGAQDKPEFGAIEEAVDRSAAGAQDRLRSVALPVGVLRIPSVASPHSRESRSKFSAQP